MWARVRLITLLTKQSVQYMSAGQWLGSDGQEIDKSPILLLTILVSISNRGTFHQRKSSPLIVGAFVGERVKRQN